MKSFQLVFKSFLFLFTICAVLQEPCLNAAGWGPTEEVSEYEGAIWNGIYFDLKGLNVRASIPNYSGAALENDLVIIRGDVEEKFAYLISTSFNKSPFSPTSLDEFVQLVQEANPDYTINAIKSKKTGIKYAVDMVPNHPENTAYWRLICTKNRLIRLGTDDLNANRRLHFFENISIH